MCFCFFAKYGMFHVLLFVQDVPCAIVFCYTWDVPYAFVFFAKHGMFHVLFVFC